MVFYFRATKYSGTIRSSEEGEVFWISREELKNSNTVPDLLKMMQVMESEELNEFIYEIEGDKWNAKLL